MLDFRPVHITSQQGNATEPYVRWPQRFGRLNIETYFQPPFVFSTCLSSPLTLAKWSSLGALVRRGGLSRHWADPTTLSVWAAGRHSGQLITRVRGGLMTCWWRIGGERVMTAVPLICRRRLCWDRVIICLDSRQSLIGMNKMTGTLKTFYFDFNFSDVCS